MSIDNNKMDKERSAFEAKSRHEIEKLKYLHCFKHGTTSNNQYGEGNHGKDAQNFFIDQDIKSLLDVGAGQGVFVNNLATLSKSLKKIYALDVASVEAGVNIKNKKITWIDGYSHNIPLEDNQVEWVTSFDCLEHILPEDIKSSCNEFYRVCSVGALVKIAYRGCIEKTHLYNELPDDHKSLHISIFSKETWVEHFKGAGFQTVKELENIAMPSENYLIFYK